MKNEILRKAGLTEAEIKVYLTLIRLGSSALSKIQENTKIERRYVYDVLNKLIEKGLVSYTVERGKKNFQVTHPNKILESVQEKKAAIEETEKEIMTALPELIELFNEKKQVIKAEIFRGKESVKALGEDMLNYKDNYFIGGNGSIRDYMPFYWEHFNKKRIEKKVMWHDLIIEGSLMKEFKDLAKAKSELRNTKFYEYRLLPSELQSPHIITIYGEKVALTLWGDFVFTFVIQNKEVADSYLKYFHFLWKFAKV